MKAIYERELKSYFYSMTGYVFIAFVTMFIGIYFMVYNMINGYPYFLHPTYSHPDDTDDCSAHTDHAQHVG